jgi:hypothetical protein
VTFEEFMTVLGEELPGLPDGPSDDIAAVRLRDTNLDSLDIAVLGVLIDALAPSLELHPSLEDFPLEMTFGELHHLVESTNERATPE